MIQLSIQTVIISHIISSAINLFVLTLLWHQNRNRFSGIGFWAANAAMQFVAILLVAMRGIIPDFISIVVGNVLIFGGAFLIYIGLEKFVGKHTPQTHNYILLIIFFLIQFYYTFIQPSLLARNVNISLGLFLIFFQVAWLLLRRASPDLRTITVNIGMIAIGICFLSLARILIDLIIPVGDDFINSNSYDTLLVMSYQMLFVILTFGLTLMVNRRLVENLEKDINERKKAEKLLSESEEKFRLSFEASNIGMAIVDRNGSFLSVNPSACNFLRYSEKEFMHKTFMDITHPQDVERSVICFNQSIEDHKPYTIEKKYIAREKQTKIGLTTVSPIFDSDHEFLYAIAHMQDVTQQKHAEKALQEREALYRQMFTEHTAIMLLIEPVSGQIVEANPAAATFYEHPVEVLQQMNIDQINISPPEKVVKDRLAAASGDQNYFVFQHRLASQEIREVEVHSVPIQIGGKTLLYSIVNDITERKLAEEALLESEEKFHTAFYASPVVMAISTLEDGEILDANAQFFKFTGYKREEVIGRKTTDLRIWSSETRESVITEIKTFGYAHNKEVNLITKNGDTVPILWFGDVVSINNKPCLISSAYDLRVQKQTEEKIKFQAKMLDTVNQAVIATDTSGKVNYLNSYAERLYGWSAKEVIGKDINEVTVPQIAVKQAQEIMEKSMRGESWEGEFRVQHRDGHVFPAFVSSTPIKDDTGKVVGVVGISKDITKRKRVEEALEESDSKHRKMIANISDVVAIMDLNGIIQYKSPNVEKHFGWRPEDLVGTSGYDTVHPDDIDHIKKEFYSLIKKKNTVKTVEYRYKRRDGEFSLIELTAVNLAHDPQINGVLMNYHDITDRKQSETALQENENRLRTIFETSQAGIILVNAKGVITFANQRMATMFGCSMTELIDSTYPEHVHTDQRKIGDDRMRQLIAGEIDSVALERHYIRKDGSDFWGFLSGRRQEDEKGNLISLVGIIADITESKQAEAAIRDALQDKEVLLRELYHRTKNNMQVISSMLNLEIERIKDRNSRKVLQDMDNRIRAMALVHQKLYQSQSLSSIDLRDYLSELANLIMANYQIAPEKVTVSIEAEPIQVLIDTAIPCGLIVNEIVSNALKYAFPNTGNGEIKIRLLHSKETDAAKINMEISDNGIGIPHEQNLLQSDTLGVQTIFGIAKHQLNAVVNLETDQGVSWHFQFEDGLYSTRI